MMEMDMAPENPESTTTGFRELGIREAFCDKLRVMSIRMPASVQRNAIPALMAGKDAIIQSGTGTGKTLAYVLPLLEAVDLEAKRLQGLVIAPTPELAMQIVRLMQELAGGGRVAALIGGASRERQMEKLKMRPPLAVGTPGRLAELLRLGKLKTGAIRFAVVDEADQVFQPGAAEEAEAVLEALPPNRQLVFVSATIGPAAEQLAMRWMKDPVRPAGESQAEVFAGVSHEFAVCDRRDKIDVVRRFVRTVNPSAAILFVPDTGQIGVIAAKLKYAGIAAEPLYADAGKLERAEAMRRMSTGKIRLLIATDLAARGLDLPRLSHVINFEPPEDEGTYLHRAGRTGRMGRPGAVVTLATPGEMARLKKLARRLDLPLRQMTLSHGHWVPFDSGDAALRKRSFGLPGQNREAARTEAGGRAPARMPESGKEAGRAAGQGLAEPAAPPVSGEVSKRKRRASREAAKPGVVPARASAEGKIGNRKAGRRRDRERDTKNKGAPRWLKEKQKQDLTRKT